MLSLEALITSKHSKCVALLIIVSLLSTASCALQAQTSDSSEESVDKLLESAQSALQQVKADESNGEFEHDTDVDRHRKATFTTPVDGYFIQV